MNNIIYHQFNITNKQIEIENLKNLQEQEFFLIGIEITDIDLNNNMHLSIDPQHTNQSQMTSLEYVYTYQLDILGLIKSFNNLFMCTIRPDMDSISTMSILTMLLNNETIPKNGDMVFRLKAIAKSDKHGRSNWELRKDDYLIFENYNHCGLPIGLPYMISDHKLSMDIKIKNMITYLNTGTFDSLDKYNVLLNKTKKESNKTTNVDIIIPKKLCFITSKHRGAVGHGYKYAPIVIAKNDKFMFGYGVTKIYGKKYTIAQYDNNKYIDLLNLKEELNKIEPGWGGSDCILGSPQTKPSIIDDDTLIKIVKEFIINKDN